MWCRRQGGLAEMRDARGGETARERVHIYIYEMTGRDETARARDSSSAVYQAHRTSTIYQAGSDGDRVNRAAE